MKPRVSCRRWPSGRGEKIVIAKAGKPCVELVPCQDQPRRVPGRFKGRIRLAEDFDRTPEALIADFEGD
jgi:antitoxin (DNA-binding transcriptional repressor) of toxin-antitoxin stability system